MMSDGKSNTSVQRHRAVSSAGVENLFDYLSNHNRLVSCNSPVFNAVSNSASWLEFSEWLTRCLDEFGLEPMLHARCVISILKQPPNTAADAIHDCMDDWTPLSATNVLSSSYSIDGFQRNSSFAAVGPATAPSASKRYVDDDDGRRRALVNCLKSVDTDQVSVELKLKDYPFSKTIFQANVEKFADEILERYAMVWQQGLFGEKQNDSVDSGVCPSPEESFQNYDEAFPPLAVENAEAEVFLTTSKPIKNEFPESDASPTKRAKLQLPDGNTIDAELNSRQRSLHSCPDLGGNTSASMKLHQKASFCCPIVKNRKIQPSPQFVIPKCWKVGSWPSRYDRSIKPAGDVPFWSCTEWFCTMHKRLEFGLLNAKLSGDAKCLATATAGSAKSGTISSADGEIFEIDQCSSARPLVQSRNDGCPQLVPEMFDAPRFILRIINEDGAKDDCRKPKSDQATPRLLNDKIVNCNSSMNQQLPDIMDFSCDSMNSVGGGIQGGSPSWLTYMQNSLEKFVFNPSSMGVFGQDNATAVDQQSFKEVGFCLPKYSYFTKANGGNESSNQFYKRQQFPTTTLDVTSKKPMQKSQQPMTATDPDSSSKTQPTAVVPISAETHFIPIRSESMEEAYFPKPGFDEAYAVEVSDEYFVYRQKENGTVVASLTTAGSNNIQHKESGGARAREKYAKRHPLSVKFRAAKPDKMCQTEDHNELDDDGKENRCTWLDGSFEIWACQPMDINKNSVKRRWTNSSSANDVRTSPSVDYDWFGDVYLGEEPGEYRSRKHSMDNVGMGDGNILESSVILPDKTRLENNGGRQLEIWQEQDELDDDLLLHYVSSISLLSPLASTAKMVENEEDLC